MKYCGFWNTLVFLLIVSCTNAQRKPAIKAPRQFLQNSSLFRHHLGINAFEWDFSDDDNTLIPIEKKNIMRSFGGFRHYLDWEKLEAEEGKYTFNPTHSGGWNYDMIYAWCKAENIEVLADIKTVPPWLLKTYPKGQRDQENVPAPYGLNRSDPKSYLKQAKLAFQFAARYGYNKVVPPALVSVNKMARWNDDPSNEVKVGLGYVKFIECDNEREKTWKGPQAYQSPEEYAANMSAFYDGHMGKLGENVGVKAADPSMKVVMGGLSDPDVNYVIKMIEWCKKNRGYKADGSVNLCFDIINYHSYNNDYVSSGEATIGRSPEHSQAAKIADEFVAMSKKHANGAEVWMTEAGYDLNPQSPQRAIPIADKSVYITQADWMIRSSFLYARHGIKRSFFFMLDDQDLNNPIQYASSGFAVNNKRRPVADYFFQTKQLLGDFHFMRNLKADPIIDVYGLKGRKIFVMFVPDQKNRQVKTRLGLGKVESARIYTLVPGANKMSSKVVNTPNGILSILLTETPVFVEPIMEKTESAG